MKDQRHDIIEVKAIELDPKNPRLPERLRDASEEEVINWMLNEASLLDLVASILENGFFPGEPIIVMKKNGDSSKFLVIEGNRRVAACKLLLNPSIAKYKKQSIDSLLEREDLHSNIPKKLPVYICNDRNYIDSYLGFRHVSGIEGWDVLAKSRFLYRKLIENNLDRNDPETYRVLARMIGSKSPYVKRLIYGYEAYKILQGNNFYGIEDIKDKDDKFEISFLTDALTMHSNIASWLSLDFTDPNPIAKIDRKRLKELTHWLYEGKQSRNARVRPRELSKLNSVLGDDRATIAFIEEGASLDEAVEFSDFADRNLEVYIKRALNNLYNTQKIIHKVEKPTQTDLDRLSEIQKIVKSLKVVLLDKLTDFEA